MIRDVPARARDPALERARTLSRWLDQRLLDPIAGLLLPGIGDLLGSVAGLYIVAVGICRRLPPVVIARMMVNLAVDSLVGAIPLIGDLFDFAFKAHRANVRLLEGRWSTGKATDRDWAVVAGAAVLFALAIAIPVWLALMLIQKLR